MLFAAYLVSSVLGLAMLALAALCATAAGRNHLSPWWVGCYATLIAGFALIAQSTGPIAAAAAGH